MRGDTQQQLGVAEVVGELLQGRGPAKDARALAWVCGLELCPQTTGEARIDGRRLLYNANTSRCHRQRSIAQCVALWACLNYGVPATAENVAAIAGELVREDA